MDAQESTLRKVDPCAVCGKIVENNSIKCEKCTEWVHKRCTRIKGSLARVDNFECKYCRGDVNGQRRKETIKLDGDHRKLWISFVILGIC